MAAWVPFILDDFRNALPVDFLSQHDAWAAEHENKADRMAEIVDEVVNRFRAAAASNPRNQIDADETKIPATGFDYAFAIAAYNLGLEMGALSTGAVAGVSTVNVVVPVDTSGTPRANAATASTSTTPTPINFMDAMGKQVVRAEIWLRLVQSGALHILGDDPFGTPTFQIPTRDFGPRLHERVCDGRLVEEDA